MGVPGPRAGECLPACLPARREDGGFTDDGGAVYIRVDQPLRDGKGTRATNKGGTCPKQLREFYDCRGFLFQTVDGKEFHEFSSSDTSEFHFLLSVSFSFHARRVYDHGTF